MRKFLILIILAVLFLPSVSASITHDNKEVELTVTSSFYSEFWFQDKPDKSTMTQTDTRTHSRLASRAHTVPPVQMQQAIDDVLDQIEQEHLYAYLKKLVGFGSRLYRAPGMANASIWLHDALKDNGRLVPSYHNFSVTTSHGTFLLSNVILTLPGLNTSSDRIYYMFAHSDAAQLTDPNQWLTNTPGADDDGSGCAAVLEAARVMSRYDFHDTIKFAFFQAEEIGLVGSARYATTMQNRNENVPGSIDYDMIGHSLSSTDHRLDLLYNPASSDLGSYLVGVNDRYKIGLTLSTFETTSSISSDIQSFYNRGFPCVMGIETDFSPYYHSLSDTIDKLNFDLIEKSTELAVASLSEWARLMYVDVSIPPGNLTITDEKPDEDDIVSVNVTINNTGNLAAPDMEVVFYSDGKQFAQTRVTIPANGTNTTGADWKAVEGTHNISVVLDPKNEIVETDETNNSAFLYTYVNDRPRAALTAAPMTVLTNENVSFNGSLSWDFVGGISEYSFTFGDGNTTDWITSPVVKHSYPEDGLYHATLRVRDVEGAVSKYSNLSIKVQNRAPTAHPSSNLSRSLTFVPIQFYSNATDSDGTVTTQWDFGDGGGSEDPAPIHHFVKSGTYGITLDIQDDDGAEASFELTVFVNNRPPVCSINASTTTGNIRTGFTFKSTASDPDGTISEYNWYLGDGTTSKLDFAEHRFDKPGNYYVRLVVRDDEGLKCESTINITIIDEGLKAVGEASPYDVFTYEEVVFTSKDSHDNEGPITYAWDFGDNTTSYKPDPSHVYRKPGVFYPQ